MAYRELNKVCMAYRELGEFNLWPYFNLWSSRSIRERLLEDIYMVLYSVTPEVEKTTMSTQTPRKTMIPSSCQVKPTTSNAGKWN